MASDSLTKVTRLAKENLALINHEARLEQRVQLQSQLPIIGV
jgi:hypothetical protein